MISNCCAVPGIDSFTTVAEEALETFRKHDDMTLPHCVKSKHHYAQ